MDIQITEFIEFNENKADHVTLIGTVNHYPQDGTFCEAVEWDKSKYSFCENAIINCIAHKNSTYDRFFEEFDKENKELFLENNI